MSLYMSGMGYPVVQAYKDQMHTRCIYWPFCPSFRLVLNIFCYTLGPAMDGQVGHLARHGWGQCPWPDGDRHASSWGHAMLAHKLHLRPKYDPLRLGACWAWWQDCQAQGYPSLPHVCCPAIMCVQPLQIRTPTSLTHFSGEVIFGTGVGMGRAGRQDGNSASMLEKGWDRRC